MNNPLQNPIAKWPFGAASVVQLTATGDQAIDIINDLTIIDGASVQATAARTLNLAISPDVTPGARIILKTSTVATEQTTPGTGFKGVAVTGVAGKTFAVEYVYDGSVFIQTAAAVQID